MSDPPSERETVRRRLSQLDRVIPPELRQVGGARFVLLDDIRSYKKPGLARSRPVLSGARNTVAHPPGAPLV